MAVSSTANRIASLFLAILLAFTLIINSVGVAYADDGTTVRLDELSFLSTICGIFNSVYLPEDVVNSDLTTWEDVSTYSNDYKWMLKQLDMHYRAQAVKLGYQYTDSTADNYVLPYIYFDAINNSAYPTVYQQFLTDGKLDFTSSLSEDEFIVIREAFNSLIKSMYDYTYNLPPDDDPEKYNMLDLAQSIDYVQIYRLDNTVYGDPSQSPNKLCDLGYGYPPYGLVKQGLFTSEELGLAENTMLAFHGTQGGTDSVIEYGKFISLIGTGATSGNYYNTVNFLNHSLVLGDGTVQFNGTVIAVDKGSNWNQREVTAYYTNGNRYDFEYTTINGQPNTSLTFTKELTQDSLYSITCYSTGRKDMCIINPICEAYIFDGYTIKNWAQSLHIGTSDAWLSPSGFTNECQGIYYPPTIENMNSIIENVYWGKYDVSGEIIDTFLGVETGSADFTEDEVPEFNYDRIEDAVASMGQQITDSIDKLKDEMLHGGDYSDANDAQGSLDDKLNEYYDVEGDLKDFANLDEVVISFWNASNVATNITAISSVSTWFMTIWDSFGPLVILFTLAIAIGLAAFLLKF